MAGLIQDALGPGVPSSVGGLAPGFDLERHDLDLTRFPNALSNDGTGALFYYRPYEGEENRNRWVIQLKGGENWLNGGPPSIVVCQPGVAQVCP